MPALAELQSSMAQALMSGDWDAVAFDAAPGPVLAAEALAVHRNTALHGLVNALRLSLPTVEALVGEAFFEQAALAFVRAAPPRSAWLTGYGASFPAFLETYEFAAGLPYLADVARLDLAIEAVGGEASGLDGPAIDLGPAILTLDASLTLLALDWPAFAIRDAVEADLALDLQREPQILALWRATDGAGVRRLGALSATVLQALLDGGDLEAGVPPGADLSVLQSEVFAAPFTRITLKAPEAQP